MKDFKDKIVLVTGSSSGIGAAAACAFASKGAKVIINYKINEQGALEVYEKIKRQGFDSLILKADIAVENDAKYLVSESIKNFLEI